MRFRLKVARRADRHIRDASEWWARNRTGAPMMFTEDLASAFALIAEFPYAGEAIDHPRIPNLHRVLLSHVQYHVYYAVHVDSRVVDVLAVWHTRRAGMPPL